MQSNIAEWFGCCKKNMNFVHGGVGVWLIIGVWRWEVLEVRGGGVRCVVGGERSEAGGTVWMAGGGDAGGPLWKAGGTVLEAEVAVREAGGAA